MKNKLNYYTNIVHWALVELVDNDKVKLIHLINQYGETNYNRDHINNFLAKRKPIPQWLINELGDTLLSRVVNKDSLNVKRLIFENNI